MDFFTLGIQEGKVVLEADTGNSIKTLITTEKYNDGHWHSIHVEKIGPE
jgi:hypothetical protein